MCRCFCLSTRTDEITSLPQNHQCHGNAELDNSGNIGNFKTMFSLTTLPAHCCSTVTSLTSSPTPITLLAKRTYISDY